TTVPLVLHPGTRLAVRPLRGCAVASWSHGRAQDGRGTWPGFSWQDSRDVLRRQRQGEGWERKGSGGRDGGRRTCGRRRLRRCAALGRELPASAGEPTGGGGHGPALVESGPTLPSRR